LKIFEFFLIGEELLHPAMKIYISEDTLLYIYYIYNNFEAAPTLGGYYFYDFSTVQDDSWTRCLMVFLTHVRTCARTQYILLYILL